MDTHGRTRTNTDGHTREEEGLIPKHGGYRNLVTFKLATLIYDVTVLFCDRYVDRRSRTHDQMVQAARSGRQNIAEGSSDSGTSKKTEMKLTGVAKGSLEELRLDYEDFLRHRGLPQWAPDHPALTRFKALRCATLEEFRKWVAEEMGRAQAENTDGHTRTDTDEHGPTRTKEESLQSGTERPPKSTDVRVGPCSSVCVADLPKVLASNGVLSLLNLCLHLLDKQVQAQGTAFELDGGFTERLYRRRREYSSGNPVKRSTGNTMD